METVKVRVRGVKPLLMNRPTEDDFKKKSKRKDQEIDPNEEALKKIHKEDGIGCYVPSDWIWACMREAGKAFNLPRSRKTHTHTIISYVIVEPEKIPFSPKKESYDDIDIRPVKISGSRVLRGRPLFYPWELEFTLTFDEKKIDKETLKDILIEGGKANRIGDYRQKFGMFEVVEFE